MTSFLLVGNERQADIGERIAERLSALREGKEFFMTDPRTPRTKEAQLPDALDQTPSDAPPREAEERGSEDAQLLAGAAAGGDVENETQGRADD